MEKIGILGGTFDPIHYGHLLLAENAKESFELDKVIFIPAGDPYFKSSQPITCDEYRGEMTKLAIQGNEKFDFSDIELRREGDTYTVDTLRRLKEENPEAQFFFIVGSDTFFQMERWYKPDEIFKMATIVVAARNAVGEDVRSHAEYINEKYEGADVRFQITVNVDISSTLIRKLVSMDRSVKYLLPDAVVDFIKEKNLYR